MAPNIPCWKKKDPEKRDEPPKYAQSVSVSDKIFFLRVLLRWTGSVWQMLWLDLLVFAVLYAAFNAFYIFYLMHHTHMRVKFESFVLHVQRIANNVPLSFLLGFFVSAVLARWWSICMLIPWINKPTIFLHGFISEAKNPELALKVRRNVLRHMNLAWIFAMRPISGQICERFSITEDQETDFQKLKNKIDYMFDVHTHTPIAKESKSRLKRRVEKINNDSCVKKSFGRLITEEETEILERIGNQIGDKDYEGEFLVPLQWSIRILKKALQCGLLLHDRHFAQLMTMFGTFQDALGQLTLYSDFNVPLVYTQVVIIGVYAFFIAEVFSSQLMIDNTLPLGATYVNGTLSRQQVTTVTNYIPIFSIFKFIFTMGWFKTAASLLNPLGDGKHDIPTNLILDYNLDVAVRIGDAQDSVYPSFLTAGGNPEEELAQLDLPSTKLTNSEDE